LLISCCLSFWRQQDTALMTVLFRFPCPEANITTDAGRPMLTGR